MNPVTTRTPTTTGPPRSPRRALSAGGLLLSAMLTLGACAGPSPDTTVSPRSDTPSMTGSAPSPGLAASEEPDASTAVTTESTTWQSTAASTDAPATARPLAGLEVTPEQAARIALDRVADSRVVAIELDRARGATVWEIDLVTATAAREIAVDAVSGAIVTDEPRDAKDVAKDNARLGRTSIDYATALRTAADAMPDGQAVEIELDDEHDTVVWEIDLITPDHRKLDVEIDAATGHIIRTKQQ